MRLEINEMTRLPSERTVRTVAPNDSLRRKISLERRA